MSSLLLSEMFNASKAKVIFQSESMALKENAIAENFLEKKNTKKIESTECAQLPDFLKGCVRKGTCLGQNQFSAGCLWHINEKALGHR